MTEQEVSPAKRVLIVDEAQKTLAVLCQQVGCRYEVVLARSYPAAILAMMDNSFAAALINISLGYEGGVTLATRLKRAYPNLVCVLMSSQAGKFRDLDPIFDYVYQWTDGKNLADIIDNAIYNEEMSEETRARRDTVLSQILPYKEMLSDVFCESIEDRYGKTVKYSGITQDGEATSWNNYNLCQYHEGIFTGGLACAIGCIGGCKHCLWGDVPFKRNLTFKEMLCQVYWVLRSYLAKGVFEKVPTVDPHFNFTGTGEPGNNWDEVAKVISFLGRMFESRLGLIVTTIGLEKDLRRMIDSLRSLDMDLSRLRVYFSLNYPDPEMRGRMMRATRGENLYAVNNCLVEIEEITGRKVTVSTAQMRGVNDKKEHAEFIAKVFPGHEYKIQPYNNQTEGFKHFPTATLEQVNEFIQRLNDAGIDKKTIRDRYVTGGDGDRKGGCGSCGADGEYSKNREKHLC